MKFMKPRQCSYLPGLFAAAVACSLLVGTNAPAERALDQPMSLIGRVVDQRGQPLGGVSIGVVREGRLVEAKYFTREDGSFRIVQGPGAPLDVVLFSHRDFFPGVIDHLWGFGGHEFQKVLYRSDDEMSPQATLAQLQAFEMVAFLGASRESPIGEWVAKDWPEKQFFGQVERLKIPFSKNPAEYRRLEEKKKYLLGRSPYRE